MSEGALPTSWAQQLQLLNQAFHAQEQVLRAELQAAAEGQAQSDRERAALAAETQALRTQLAAAQQRTQMLVADSEAARVDLDVRQQALDAALEREAAAKQMSQALDQEQQELKRALSESRQDLEEQQSRLRALELAHAESLEDTRLKLLSESEQHLADRAALVAAAEAAHESDRLHLEQQIAALRDEVREAGLRGQEAIRLHAEAQIGLSSAREELARVVTELAASELEAQRREQALRHQLGEQALDIERRLSQSEVEHAHQVTALQGELLDASSREQDAKGQLAKARLALASARQELARAMNDLGMRERAAQNQERSLREQLAEQAMATQQRLSQAAADHAQNVAELQRQARDTEREHRLELLAAMQAWQAVEQGRQNAAEAAADRERHLLGRLEAALSEAAALRLSHRDALHAHQLAQAGLVGQQSTQQALADERQAAARTRELELQSQVDTWRAQAEASRAQLARQQEGELAALARQETVFQSRIAELGHAAALVSEDVESQRRAIVLLQQALDRRMLPWYRRLGTWLAAGPTPPTDPPAPQPVGPPPSAAANVATTATEVMPGPPLRPEVAPIAGTPPPTDPPIMKHVNQLMALHDETFVVAAYRALLGRDPDPDGRAFFLSRVRTEHDKASILFELATSEEGRRHDSKLAGLPELLSSRRTRASRPRQWLDRLLRIDLTSARIEAGVAALGDDSAHAMARVERQVDQALSRIAAMESRIDQTLGRVEALGERWLSSMSPGLDRLQQCQDELAHRLDTVVGQLGSLTRQIEQANAVAFAAPTPTAEPEQAGPPASASLLDGTQGASWLVQSLQSQLRQSLEAAVLSRR